MRAVPAPLRCLVLLLVFWQAAYAHPEFGTNSVVNSASFMPVKLPAGKIARGSIFTIFGTDMGPAPAATNPAFPLLLEIGGVKIVIQSKASVEKFSAVPLFAGPFQVNAIMPSDIPLGPATIIVLYQGGLIRPNSNPVDVEIVESSFGIFTVSSTGKGPAAISNFVAPGNTPINSHLESARPGQVVTVWGTGLGPIDAPDNLPPPAGALPVDVEVFVGGKKASVLYAGRSPCCSGLDQVDFATPLDVPTGCYVPLFIRLNGQVVSNGATMSVSEEGGTCSDPLNPLTQEGAFGQPSFTLGAVGLQKTSLTDPGSGQIAVTDQISGVFGIVRRPAWYFDPALSLPALGACTSYQYLNRTGGLTATAPLPPKDLGDALAVMGGLGNAPVPRLAAGRYFAALGVLQGSALVLSPGTATVSSQGGSGISPFQAVISTLDDVGWNSSPIGVIDRSQGVQISWTTLPAGTDHVRIMGISESSLDALNNENGVFLCTAPANTNSFFVPPEALSNVPASATAGGILGGAIYVGAAPARSALTLEAPGIDVGIADSVSYVGRLVEFR